MKPASWTLYVFGGCPKSLKWSSQTRPMTDLVRKDHPQNPDQPSLFLSLHYILGLPIRLGTHYILGLPILSVRLGLTSCGPSVYFGFLLG